MEDRKENTHTFWKLLELNLRPPLDRRLQLMAAPVPRMYVKVSERERERRTAHMHLLKTVFFLQPYLCALLNTLLKREGCTGSELLIQSKDFNG